MSDQGEKAVSSPAATGGAGTHFEQHVGATLLAFLLVRGIPPVLTNCLVTEVHLQVEHKGWQTDDALVVGTDGSGVRRNLACQVKRTFTISKSDDDCRKAFLDFWQDFTANSEFQRGRDAFALVTLRGTNVLLGDFTSLLDASRAASSADDFAHRLRKAGVLSNKARKHATVVREILEEKGDVDDTDLWQFFMSLHVVSYDLTTSTAQTEALVKTMLRQSTSEPDGGEAAEAAWLQLVKTASSSMPKARSFLRADLPEELRGNYSEHRAIESEALRVLGEHSKTVLDGVVETVSADISLPRADLVGRLLGLLEEERVVVVTGPAGSGKSVIAKRALEVMSGDHLCFAFRAEEFDAPHLDATLHRAQVGITADRLSGMLAVQGRKVLLVESVERLLEASTRESFTDLLRRVGADKNWRVVLTCRDYSIEIVRSSLLAHARLGNGLLSVPDLADEELQEVVAQVPALEKPARNKRLSKLLRRPYVLDMASRMEWGSEATLPENERSFRLKFWGEIVREDVHGAGGLPRRRSAAFVEIALRRARALSPLADCSDLDQEAVAKLRASNLLFSQVGYQDSAAAPAHDVLEDWAVLHWLDERFQFHERSASKLSEDVGGLPALRRGYRRWMSEILECEPEDADGLVLDSLSNVNLPPYFKDDTVVAMLLSSEAAQFLARHKGVLLQSECALLRRIIHLLRVACRASPPWIKGDPSLPSELLVPQGVAWAPVLQLVVSAIEELVPTEAPLLAGLIDDWSKSVAWWNPSPEGAKDAAAIAFALLPISGSYRLGALRSRVFGVIAKVPKESPDDFLRLLNLAGDLESRDFVGREFAAFLLEDMNAGFACRDFPDEVIVLAERRFCMTDDDLRGDIRFSSSGVAEFFGLRAPLEHDFFPPSSLRGPFFGLLQYHPDKGCDFIIRLWNHATTWYSGKKWPGRPLEDLFEVSIDIPGHGVRKQLANGRFWGAYRNMTVAPSVLECALMALESWLLGLAAKDSPHTEAWLLKCLRDSDSVAVTAVVASVCMAYPRSAGTAGLALLSCRDFFEMDRSRQINESSLGLFSHMLAPGSRVYGQERKESGGLPHRSEHLENLAVRLQLTDKRDDIFRLIDEFRKALPEPENQTSEHKLWRLALHRMDIRAFEPTKLPEGQSSEGDAEARRQTYFAPRAPDPDIEEMLEPARKSQGQLNADLGLMNWARAVWDGDAKAEPALWRDKLSLAKQRLDDAAPVEDFARGGPSNVACVCLRDHWEDLDQGGREWCVGRAVEEIAGTCDDYEMLSRVSKMSSDPSRPSAYVLPKVYAKLERGPLMDKVRLAIAQSLTHPSEEVVNYAALGVGEYLASDQPEFVVNAVGALARKARLVADLVEEESKKPYQQRRQTAGLDAEIDPAVREAIFDGGVDSPYEISRLDFETWSGRALSRTILTILNSCPDLPIAQDAHRSVARTLAGWWERDRSERGNRRDRHFEFEHESMRQVARFVLRLSVEQAASVCEPLLASAEYEQEVEPFASELIYAEDVQQGPSPFWSIWQNLANKVRGTRWVGRLNALDAERSVPGLLRAVFLVAEWKEGIDHWSRLEGEAHRVDAFFLQMPPSGASLEGYLRFLSAIGSRSLPDAFLYIAKKLGDGDADEMLARTNASFILESLLRRYVYSEPVRLKSTPKLRVAVLRCLDSLVEAGSSGAYRLRDDFVTPLPSA